MITSVPRFDIPRIARGFTVAALAASPAWTQAQKPSSLPPVVAALPHGFTQVGAVRELADGRLLIADAGENRLFAGDFRSGAVTQIGRDGGGAGEYRTVRAFFPLAGDSTLLPDPRNGRWLLLRSDTIVGAIASDSPLLRLIGGSPVGADQLGWVVGTPPRMTGSVPRMDSLLVVRGNRSTGRVDTSALIMPRKAAVIASGQVDLTRMVPIVFNPLASGEQVTVFPDGWIAIARLDPYRVDWVAPDGRRVAGRPLPFTSVRVDETEQTFALDREAQQLGQARRDVAAVGVWPETVPPFLQSATLASRDGTLWVRRAESRRFPWEGYDIVGRRGELLGRLATPANERVIGFGRASIYTVATDADGLQWVRRRAALTGRLQAF